jgi:ribosome-binding factor A
MSVDRMVRVNALLRRVVAEAMYRVMTEEGFDIASVTITGVDTSTTLRSARVRVSIREHVADRNAMLRLIRKHAPQIQDIVHREVILKYTPRLDFVLDDSIEKGDHVLDVIHKMEENGLLKEPEPAPPPEALPPDVRSDTT